MPENLDELRRQRELQRERLEWLDREIAAQEGMPREEAGDGAAPQAQSLERGPSAEQILDEFRQPPGDIQRRTRLGCITYFAVFMAILVLLAAALYMRERLARAGH